MLPSVVQGFSLTRDQKTILQHYLPKCYILLPASQSFKTAQPTKEVNHQEQSNSIVKSRGRGRPEKFGYKKDEESQRKSLRISSQKNLEPMEQKLQEQSEQQSSSDMRFVISLDSLAIGQKEIVKEKQINKTKEEPKGQGKTQKQQKNIQTSLLKAQQKKQISKRQIKKSATLIEISQQKLNNQQKHERPVSQKKKQGALASKKDSFFTKNTLQPSDQKNEILQRRQIILPDRKQQQHVSRRLTLEWQAVQQLKNHPKIMPFLQPVDEQKDGAPDYYKQIVHPIDLQTIQFKLANDIYNSPQQFQKDIQLLWDNSLQYNQDNPFMTRITKELQKFYRKVWEKAIKQRKSSLLGK